MTRAIDYVREGVPCNHAGCLSHISHPCEGCGRVAGRVKMTHKDLVLRAEKWLLNSTRCGFVLRELVAEYVSGGGEIPDAIGWRRGCETHLVECKTSMKDFRHEKNKRFRKFPMQGMGVYRYYMCPPGVIKIEDLPPDWGLLYCFEKIVRVVHKPEKQFSSRVAEMCLLTLALRRVKIRGDLEKIYDYNTIPK